MPRYFILDGHTPVACDLLTWSRWFATDYENRHVNCRRPSALGQ
jgi:hypothetical protein